MRALRNYSATTGINASATGLTALDQTVAAFSFGAWVRMIRNAASTVWTHTDTGSLNGIFVNANSNRSFGLSIRNGAGQTGYASPSGVAEFNVWMHVCVSYDGANIRYYKNGVLIAIIPGTVLPTVGGTRQTTIGVSTVNMSHDVWDLRVFPGLCLSHGDMRRVADPLSIIAGCKQRLAYQRNWRAAGSGAVTLYDESGNNTNLTTSATTSVADTAAPPPWRSILFGSRQFGFRGANAPTPSAAVVAQPETVLSDTPFTLSLEKKAGAIRDTAFTGTATITKVSGTGTLAGTTTSAAFVAGLGSTSVHLNSSEGKVVLRATLSTGETVDFTYMRVRRQAGPIAGGGYTGVQSVRDPVLNGLLRYKFFVPSGYSNTGTAWPVVFWCGDAQSYLDQAGAIVEPDAGGAIEAAIAATFTGGNSAIGTWIDANKTSYPALFVSIPIPTNSNFARWSWEECFPAVLAQMVADGWHIDLKRIGYAGYSTGGLQAYIVRRRHPTLFASMVMVDGATLSWRATISGAPIVGPGENAFPLNQYDVTAADGTPVPQPPLAGAAYPFLKQVAVDWCSDGCATLVLHGNGSQTYGSSGRNAYDMQPVFDYMEIVSPGITTQGSNNTTLTANPAHKHIYFRFPTSDHTAMETLFANSTNIAALNAWMFGQARTTDAAITITKINPQVRGTSVHEGQRDTRARVLSIADARPMFTFIR